MTAPHCPTCTCLTPERIVAEQNAEWIARGWYDDEDRMGYEQGHVCCPDCGCDKDDHTLHRDDCRRCFPIGHPLEYLQMGPPWYPWPQEFEPLPLDALHVQYRQFCASYIAEHGSPYNVPLPELEEAAHAHQA